MTQGTGTATYLHFLFVSWFLTRDQAWTTAKEVELQMGITKSQACRWLRILERMKLAAGQPKCPDPKQRKYGKTIYYIRVPTAEQPQPANQVQKT
jgi:hypothetical protein